MKVTKSCVPLSNTGRCSLCKDVYRGLVSQCIIQSINPNNNQLAQSWQCARFRSDVYKHKHRHRHKTKSVWSLADFLLRSVPRFAGAHLLWFCLTLVAASGQQLPLIESSVGGAVEAAQGWPPPRLRCGCFNSDSVG